MGLMQPVRRIRRNEEGATILEFALVASVFFMLMFGIIEYGLIMLTKVAVESAVIESGRSSSLGNVVPGCTDRVCTIKKLVYDKTFGLISKESVIVDATVVTNSSTASPRIPDICLDNPAVPYPASCITRQENNGIPGYQPPNAITAASIGVPGDLVEIRVTYLWRVIFPVFKSKFGTNGVLTISSSTVVKNEPYE